MKKIWQIVVVISTVLGILATIFGLYTYFYPDKAEPYYMVLNDELIVSSPNSRIKIFYDSVEVPNVKSMDIAFWNQGKKYLEKSNIIAPYLVRLSNKNANILQTEILKKSRTSLDFDVIINRDNLKVSLEGKEVLESNDGVIIRIFYTLDTQSTWTVESRILGNPTGFKEYTLTDQVYKPYSTGTRFISNIVFTIFLYIVIFIIALYILKKIVCTSIIKWNIFNIYKKVYFIFIILMFLLLIYICCLIIYINLSFPEFLINMESI